MRRTLDWSLLLGLGLFVALLVVNAALNYRNTDQLHEDLSWVSHTNEVLDLTNGALLALVDAETGQRGFVITGQDEYLKPYDDALNRVDQLLAQLKQKTEDNPRQQERINTLESLTAERISLLKQGIELRRKDGDEAQALIVSGQGKAKMDALRALVAEMREDEFNLLNDREADSRTAYRTAVTTGLVAAVLGLATVGAFMWLLQRSLRAREKAAAAIHEQREWLRTTLASIGDGVIATDTDGRVTFLNPVAGKLTGWTEAEAQDQSLETVFAIVNEETRRPVENPALRAIRDGVIVGLANHTILISKNGMERPIDDSAAPIRDAAGRVAGSVLVFRDITERKRAEDALHEQQEWLRVTLASIGDAVIATDTSANVRFLNPVAEALTGWTQPEARGKPLLEVFKIVNEQTRQPVDSPVARALREGVIVGLANHTLLIAKDGSERAIDDSAAPIRDESGQIVGAVLVCRDITGRKRIEDDLRKSAADLSQADRRKNEFLAVLAHELRNPLAPITTALELMRITESSGEDVRPLREMMERQVQQMVHLIDDLLDVSRISSGKIVLRKERLDVSSVVNTALEASRPLIDGARHELTLKLPDEPLEVEGDKTRLAQVLSNLLANAAKYTPEAGHIWLTVGQDGRQAVIRVRDSGMGIPAEMVPLIFEMFTQVDRNLGRSQGGLGIGLALVRSMVELHGGTVEASSDGPGKGSEFVVRLPLAPQRPDRPETNGESNTGSHVASGTSQLRILVVDDNKDAAETLQRLLKILGHDVLIAHDGQNALALAATFRPHAVLLDIGLPGMSGHEVGRRMRQMPEVKDAVLVAQTGWGQDEDKRQSDAAGFNAHLVKPVDPAALRRLLAGLPRKLD